MNDQPAEPPVQVEARVDSDGPPQPLAFRWRGRRLRIYSVGRAWQEAGEHHYLVMVPGDQVYQLAFGIGTGAWRMVREPDDFGPPGANRSA